MPLLIRNARALTLAGPAGRNGMEEGRGNGRAGAELATLRPVLHADVVIDEGVITHVGSVGSARAEAGEGVEIVDAGGRVLMPAFIDCHTHACWAGERLDEWEMKRNGATYLEILAAGGGIMSTVRAVRQASEESLAARLLERLNWMLAEGTTTVEVKSGYGLSTDDELKMLRAITRAGAQWAGTVVPTACLGHAIDSEVGHDDFVEQTIAETLPAVHEAFPGITIDAYCETGAWSLGDCIRLFDAARELDHPVRVHADQFNSLGMIPAAIHLGARSVDHLEATRPQELTALAESRTFGVMLPCSGFHVDGRYADGRGFVDAGGRLCIATNCNPGSAPCVSMPMAIALAERHLGLTTAEAIAASTVNAAALLGLDDRGTIEEGQRADLLLLRHADERQLGHTFGGNPAQAVFCKGTLVAGSLPSGS